MEDLRDFDPLTRPPGPSAASAAPAKLTTVLASVSGPESELKGEPKPQSELAKPEPKEPKAAKPKDVKDETSKDKPAEKPAEKSTEKSGSEVNSAGKAVEPEVSPKAQAKSAGSASRSSGSELTKESSPKSTKSTEEAREELSLKEATTFKEFNDKIQAASSVADDRRRSSIISIPKPEGTGSDDAPFDFQSFLDVLRQKQAEPIAKYIKSFLQEFCKRSWSTEQQVKIVDDFRIFITAQMAQSPPFAELERRRPSHGDEGVEKLIMNRLYTRTFSPKMPASLRRDGHEEDLLRDRIFEEKMRIWSWIEGRHLDVNDEYLANGQSFIRLAAKELTKINQYRAPRDKVICVLNCSKVVWALIRQAKLEQNADSFLPLLIYVVLQAQPPHLISNINYISRFRAAAHTVGETGYYLSMLASAAAFIEGLEKSSLSIAEDEYEQKIEQAVKQEAERSRQLELTAEQQPPDTDPDMYPSSVLTASAGLLVEQFKSLTARMFEPDVERSAPATPAPDEGERSPEEAAARQASAEEYRAREAQEQEFAQVSETLQQMFPLLDKEVIEDVLREKGTRIGSAVDVCLMLVGEP